MVIKSHKHGKVKNKYFLSISSTDLITSIDFRVITPTTTPAPIEVPSWQNQQADITETTTPITTTIPSWQQARPVNQWNGYQVPSQSKRSFRRSIEIIHMILFL